MNQGYPTGSRRSDPASPKDLARRLAELSPRHSPVLIPNLEDVRASEEMSSLDSSDTSDIGSASTDALGLITNAEGSPRGISEFVNNIEVADEDEEALRQSIKGLYTLWRLSRSRKGVSSGQDDRAVFMRVIEDTLA